VDEHDSTSSSNPFPSLSPDLQIAFAQRLETARAIFLRLLLGFSQKEFYDRKGASFRRFRVMEERGVIDHRHLYALPSLCRSLARTTVVLLEGLGAIDTRLVHELQRLTLGPQFRGSRNTDLGKEAVALVRNLSRTLLDESVISTANEREIRLRNAAGRAVVLRFGADPDVSISEEVSGSFRHRTAIEVQVGTDA
jgi:hypothetical protein